MGLLTINVYTLNLFLMAWLHIAIIRPHTSSYLFKKVWLYRYSHFHKCKRTTVDISSPFVCKQTQTIYSMLFVKTTLFVYILIVVCPFNKSSYKCVYLISTQHWKNVGKVQTFVRSKMSNSKDIVIFTYVNKRKWTFIY